MRTPIVVMIVATLGCTGCQGVLHPLFGNHTCPMPQLVFAPPQGNGQIPLSQWNGQQQMMVQPIVAQLPQQAPQAQPVVLQQPPAKNGPELNAAEGSYEESPTVLETLIALREKMDNLQKANIDLKEQLDVTQQQTASRVQATEDATTAIVDELAVMQNKLDAWRGDVTQLRGRLRDQQTRHEQTLRDVEEEISSMIDQYSQPVGVEAMPVPTNN